MRFLFDLFGHGFERNKSKPIADLFGCKAGQNKKPEKVKKRARIVKNSGSFLQKMVRLTGFEPTTSRVGVWHSIQLSYSRIFMLPKHYSKNIW